MGLSDHCFIHCKICISKHETIFSPNIKEINCDSFKQDLQNLNLSSSLGINSATDTYSNDLLLLLDRYTPITSKPVTVRPNKKSFNSNLRKAITFKRRLQRKYDKSKLDIDKNALEKQTKYYNFLLNGAKSCFNAKAVNDAQSDIRRLFTVTKITLN